MWGQDRVSDWVPRLVLHEMRPGHGPGLCTKACIGRSVTRTRLGAGFQSWYGDEMGPRQGQGLGAKAGIG